MLLKVWFQIPSTLRIKIYIYFFLVHIYLPNCRKSRAQSLLWSSLMDCMKMEKPNMSEWRCSSRWQLISFPRASLELKVNL